MGDLKKIERSEWPNGTLFLNPQPGPQTKFLSSKADICFYGGEAGGGKSFGLLLEILRNVNNSRFDAVIFRRTIPEITNPGALFDTASDLYIPLKAIANQAEHFFVFPSGMKVKMSHLQHEKDKYDWQGSQVTFIGFDEVTHFTESQFFYMLSRLRSDANVDGYVRATCNPDSDSWVAQFISWWIDQETGYPIPERDGVLRWFKRVHGQIQWFDEKVDDMCKSVTFIHARLEDNQILMQKNPGYLANLESLPYVERMRLRGGNWKIRPAAGNLFKREWFPIIEVAPQCVRWIRYWDRASSKKPNAANTAGVLMGITREKQIIIADVMDFKERPLGVRDNIRNTATQDGINVWIGIEQDPGQAGDAEADDYTRLLSGFTVKKNRVSKDKIKRAEPFSAQCEAGNVKLVRGAWNKDFLDEAAGFPDSKLKDRVDAASGAFFMLTSDNMGEFSSKHVGGGRSKLVPKEEY